MNADCEFGGGIWSGVLIAVGLGLSVVHLVHLTRDSTSLAMVIGVLMPLAISVVVAGVGVLTLRDIRLASVVPSLTTWMLIGMVWMAVAGTGTVLFENGAGTALSHEGFMIVIFSTYGCLPGLLTGWYDGNRRAQIRRVSRREEQLTVLARILRHNLRNSMNVMVGHAETLAANVSEGDVVHAETIIEEGQSLLAVTEKERVLVETIVDPRAVDIVGLDPVLQSIDETVRDRFPDAECELPEETGCRVWAVPMLETALSELVENAIVHNETESPRVRITVTQADGTVQIAVADNGEGIRREEIELLEGTRSMSPVHHGSGLGLRLADLIVEQSNGDLEFHTREPHGTEATISLADA